MKKLILSVTLACAFGVTSSAQGRAGRADLYHYFNDTKAGAGSLMQKVGAKETDNAIGSPYLMKTFSLATISGVDDLILVKYNAYSDEIELDSGNNKIFILPKDMEFHTITLKTGQVYRLFEYKDDGKDVKGYLLEKASNNGVSLLVKEKIILIPEKQSNNGYGTYSPPKFNDGGKNYYLEMKDKSVVAFPKNKKKLAEILTGKEAEVANFLKSNKISFKDEQDMIKVVNFIATL